ncbi:MAG TPA: glycosyltransferase [Candidatus Bipolaricaulota bacterium]|nr:glycosyltransferase [Candidatus Bipolaricaulota bacterium]
MSNILILKFPYQSQFGGGEKYTLELVERLKKEDFNFFLMSSDKVLTAEFEKRNWPQKYWWVGVEPVAIWALFLFPILAIYSFLSLLAIIVYYRIKHKTKILFCLSLTEKILITPMAKLLGYKVIWQEHVSIERWLTKNPYRFLYQWWSRLATVVCVSEFVKKELEKIKVKNVKVIYNGIDLSKKFFQEDIYQNLADKNYSDFEKKHFNVCSISRLSHEKNLGLLIKAIGELKTEIPDIHLTIIGEGPSRQDLEGLIDILKIKDSVVLFGFQENVYEWLEDFDLFVLPSKKEAFGIAILEAMLAKVPVIAANVGGLPEIIKNNENGLLFETDNVQDLKQAILKLYNNPDLAKKFKAAGLETARNFSMEKMIDGYRNFL